MSRLYGFRLLLLILYIDSNITLENNLMLCYWTES